MKELDEISQNKIDDELRMVFNKTGLENPSSAFTGNLMNVINLETSFSHQSYKAIISHKGWIGISVTFLFIIIISVLFLSPNKSITPLYFSLSFNYLSEYFHLLSAKLVNLIITVISSKWLIFSGLFFVIGYVNFLLQQKNYLTREIREFFGLSI